MVCLHCCQGTGSDHCPVGFSRLFQQSCPLATESPDSFAALVIRFQVQNFMFILVEVMEPPSLQIFKTGCGCDQRDLTGAALSRRLN